MLNDHARRASDLNDVDTPQSRADRLRAEQVEVALVMQEMLGTSAAASYLCEKRIAVDVASRVLTRPWERRWRVSVDQPAFNGVAAMV